MVTAVVLTKNEEKNIVDCLESLSFCNEIIVVDDNSQDRTIEIAKRMGATVLSHPLKNDFSKQRNYGLRMAKNDWVLFIDADERVNNVLAKEIDYVLSKNKYDAFLFKRQDSVFGRELRYGETGNIWLLRLARKESGKWIGTVHERWVVNGNIKKLNNPLNHFPHQSVVEFIKEINYYTDLRAKELYESSEKVYWYSMLIYPKSKFLVNYILKLGFLDGIPGLIIAIVMSFHSFLVRGKLWQLNQRH